jgi:hypothetical protein
MTKALLADDAKEHARYRVDPKALTADAVFRFAESLDAGTRALGMKLIARDPALAAPEELFRLAESPDRMVRAFVVRALWSLYRDRGITPRWKPAPPPAPTVAQKDAKKPAEPAKPAEAPKGGAPARPEKRPASDEALAGFLRRVLFTVPPGRLPKDAAPVAAEPAAGTKATKQRPMPARLAKLGLVETLRDLAVEDAAFARVVLPLFREMLASRGQSERAACLVAIARIEKAHSGKKDAA